MKRLPVLTLLSAILFGMITTLNAQIVNSVYYPKRVDSSLDMSKVKTNINNMLGKKTIIRDKKNNIGGTPQDVVVLDDRIEFKIKDQKLVILFSDIIDDEIVSTETNKIAYDGKSYQGPNPFSCQVDLNNFAFYFKGFTNCDKFADDFFFIQFKLRARRYDTLLTDFKPIAEKYIALSTKPAMSEEQRKFIVQANSLNKDKEYYRAIELYNKAIEIDPTAYPAAYTNLALLSAQIEKFDAAIFYMKKYLMLLPGAEDARSAQDKIYEWELKIPH